MVENDNRQARYNSGCPVFIDSGTASDGRAVLIELWQQNQPQLAAGAVLPETAYRRAIKP